MEHKHTVGSTLLLLTLDDPVALDRPAHHPGTRAVLGAHISPLVGIHLFGVLLASSYLSVFALCALLPV